MLLDATKNWAANAAAASEAPKSSEIDSRGSGKIPRARQAAPGENGGEIARGMHKHGRLEKLYDDAR
jgi:hypothetical protein